MLGSPLRGRLHAGRGGGRTVLLAAALVLTFVGAEPTTAADLVVPPDVRASLAVRMLEYDRALKTWAGAELKVGVVGRNNDSADTATFRQELHGRAARGIPIKALDHVYHDAATLKEWIAHNDVRLVYLAVDLAPETVAAVGAAGKVATLVASRAQFDSGAALGIVVKEGRPRILIRLPATKAAGMDFDPKLLDLAEVAR